MTNLNDSTKINSDQAVHAVIYTKPNCMPCKMTTRLLDSKQVPYVNSYYGNSNETNDVDVMSPDNKKRTWSEQKVEKLKAKYNIQSLPLIKIVEDDSGKELDFWSGFRPDKIKEWFE